VFFKRTPLPSGEGAEDGRGKPEAINIGKPEKLLNATPLYYKANQELEDEL